MKKVIFFLGLICTLSSCKGNRYIHVKDGILYKDKMNNIYIKNEIYIVYKKDSLKSKQSRYFDVALYNDSIVKLKNFVDVNTFVKSLENEFKDKSFIYLFNDKPGVFPSIEIFRK